MKFIDEVLDQYNLRARFFPASLLVVPVALVIVAVFPLNYQGPVGIVAAIVTIILVWYLADYVRERGQDAQIRLYQQWGGKPFVLLLSHFQSIIATDTLTRCHDKLRELDPKLKIPLTREEEQADPVNASAVYLSCNDLLLERTRDKAKFGLVFEENIRYGMRRNLYGVRWLGLALSLLGLSLSLVAAIIRAYRTSEADAVSVIGCVTGCLLAFFWLFVVRAHWVRRQADQLAYRLILSAQALESKDTKPAKTDGV